jgi:hypothetical protein
LAKLEGPVPISLRVTNTVRKRKDDRNRTTDDDYKVVEQARRLICNHPNLQGRCRSEEAAREVIGPVVDAIIALFHKVDSPELIKTRLESLKEHQFEKDSFLPGLIDEHWENRRENSGNSKAAGISNPQIATNNEYVGAWIDKFVPRDGQTRGRSFWIKMGETARETKQIAWAESKSKDKDAVRWKVLDFPGPYNIFEGKLKFESIRERLKPRKRKKQTRHTRATRYDKYGLELDCRIGKRDKNRSYTLAHFTFKDENQVRKK